MKKFWVRVNQKHSSRYHADMTAVYGTIEDAREYAYVYMGCDWKVNIAEIFDTEMNLVDTFEF